MVEKENALNELFCVLHLVDGLFLDERAQLVIVPVLAHFSVQEVLIYGSKLFVQCLLQRRNDL